MQPRTYQNFDLSIRLDESGGIEVSVLDSPAGEANELLAWPFTAQDVEIFLLRVGHTRRGVRRINSPEMEAARTFGEQLYDAVFSGTIGTSFEQSIEEADRQGQGLRLRLHTEQFQELSDVPWEFLYSPSLHRFLTVSTATPLVRYIEHSRLIQPLAVDEAVRVLTMVSNPSDVADLDVEGEWARINGSLGGLVDQDLIEIHRLSEATMGALQRELRQRRYHVFHFIGHGAFDSRSDQGVLLFEDDRGRSHEVSGEHLGTILHDQDSLRLVVLNSCEGARSSPQDPFGGTAQGLVRQGIPAVIAMQFEITDKAAITFAHDFYAAIADGFPVDAALAEARKAIFTSGNDVEWGTPVLHMRAPDGKVFDRVQSEPSSATALDSIAETGDDLSARLAEADRAVSESAFETAIDQLGSIVEDYPDSALAATKLADARRLLRAQRLYAGAQVLFAAEQWQAVSDRFVEIKALDSDFPDPDGLLPAAEAALAEEKRISRLDTWYQEAKTAIAGEAWDDAVRLVDLLELEDPAYRDVGELAVQAKTGQTASRLHAAARESFDAGEWQSVISRFDELRLLGAGYAADPDSLEATARQRLSEEEKRRRLQAQYDAAIALIEEEDWDAAFRIVGGIKAEQADYPGIEKLQDTIRERARQQKLEEEQRRAEALLATAEQNAASGQWEDVIATLDEVDQIVAGLPGSVSLRELAQGELQNLDSGDLHEEPAPATQDEKVTDTEPEASTQETHEPPEETHEPPEETHEPPEAGKTRRNLLWIGGGAVLVAGVVAIGLLTSNETTPTTRPLPPTTAAPPATDAALETTVPPTTQPPPTTTSPPTTTAAPTTTLPVLEPPSDWNLVLADSFGDDVGDWGTGPVDLDYVTADRMIEGSVYRWEIAETTGVLWRDWAAPEVGDFFVAVEGEFVEGAASYGLFFRSGGTPDSYYLFEVHSGGTFDVYLRADDQWEPVVETSTATVLDVAGPNRISVLAEGSRFEFAINDSLVAEANHSGLASGATGLYVYAGDSAIVQFDNFELYSPDVAAEDQGPPTPSWIAIVASLPVDEYTKTMAEGRLDSYRLTADIGLDLILSSDYGSLNPGYWVIFAQGDWTDRGPADDYCNAMGDAFASCYARLLER